MEEGLGIWGMEAMWATICVLLALSFYSVCIFSCFLSNIFLLPIVSKLKILDLQAHQRCFYITQRKFTLWLGSPKFYLWFWRVFPSSFLCAHLAMALVFWHLRHCLRASRDYIYLFRWTRGQCPYCVQNLPREIIEEKFIVSEIYLGSLGT